MAYLVATQTLLLVALVWLQHHNHRKEVQTIHGLLDLQDTQRTADLERVDNLLRAQHAHMAAPHPDLTALIDLVDRLCQRIQAPEHAIVDHQLAQPLPPSPPAVNPEDDAAFWAAQDIPKEDLAEQLMAEEINGT